MKFKVLILSVLVFSSLRIYAGEITQLSDTLPANKPTVIDTDSLLEESESGLSKSDTLKYKEIKNFEIPKLKSISLYNTEPFIEYFQVPAYIAPINVDSLLLQGNPFFIDLVFMGHSENYKLEYKPDYQTIIYGGKPTSIDYPYTPIKTKTVTEIISDLRQNARDEIARKAVNLYTISYSELPDPETTKYRFIKSKPLTNIQFTQKERSLINDRKLIVRKERLGPWHSKANLLLQFSQNMVSSNWHQGGNSTLSVLGILNGQLNYDNSDNIQWENSGEWRLGINAIFNDSTAIRNINTNDDVVKINSKFGIKAGDNLFYSGSLDFSTQLFHSYKDINSTTLTGTFLTPIRINVGMGLDYKYKKLFSLMLSPVSYKYIYINETDESKINPNLFGIETGKRHLSEIGSSLKGQLSYSPYRELQVDSKLTFYTNYQKVEIDWEIVGNFTINRFLSTRLSFNPRFDNTVIGEKAFIQFKELLSFGLAYKLLR